MVTLFTWYSCEGSCGVAPSPVADVCLREPGNQGAVMRGRVLISNYMGLSFGEKHRDSLTST